MCGNCCLRQTTQSEEILTWLELVTSLIIGVQDVMNILANKNIQIKFGVQTNVVDD